MYQWPEVIKMLAESFLDFRGNYLIPYEYNNGNILKLIKLLADFDPKIVENIQVVLYMKDSCRGKTIRNEIIESGFQDKIIKNSLGFLPIER